MSLFQKVMQPPRLGQEFFDDFSLTEGHRTADGRLQLLFEVDTKLPQNRGMDIFDVARVRKVLESIFLVQLGRRCSLSNDFSPFYATASEGHTESVGPVISSPDWVYFGGTAKFPSDEDEGFFEEASFGQLGNERGDGRIEDLAILFAEVEVVGVGVPAAKVDFNAAYADFDQLHRSQAGTTKGSITEGVAQGLRGCADIEGAELVGGHHLACGFDAALVERANFVELLQAATCELLFDRAEGGDAAAKALGRDAAVDVGNGADGIKGFESVKLFAEVAASRGPLAWKDGDVARDLDVVCGLMAEDCAKRGMNEGGVGAIAGLGVVGGALVITFFAGE